jgi:putative hydrolase of the HAD superfamily
MVGVPDNWTLGGFVADCARAIGLSPTQEDADVYQNLYLSRLPEFVRVNMARDPDLQKAFWERLAVDWLDQTGQSQDLLRPMQESADVLGFGPNSILFRLYDDVIPCLDRLAGMGIQLAVISNWDYSLHRVLKMFGIYDRFVVVKASLEEGVEKPDPRLFEMTLAEAGFTAAETFHVGDDVVDDLDGAKGVGIRAVLIDRSRAKTDRPVIHTLADLPEAFGWID